MHKINSDLDAIMMIEAPPDNVDEATLIAAWQQLIDNGICTQPQRRVG